MAFAGAVYTVQQDWKVAHDKKVTEIQQLQTQLQEKEEQVAYLNKDLDATKAIQTNLQTYVSTYLEGKGQEMAAGPDDDKWRGQLSLLATDLRTAQGDVADLKTDVASLEQQLKIEQEKYEKLETENQMVMVEAKERAQEANVFKGINKDLNDKLALAQDELFNLKNELFNWENDSKIMDEKQKGLLRQVAHLSDVIRRENIDEKAALAKDEPPPVVYGKVVETKAQDRTGPELVQINIGSDDGLAVGHTLHVYRTGERVKYLGAIHLVSVAPDGAVGKVFQKSKNGIIQRAENITTKL
ncbi:MAG: hypothetical protein KDA84_04410 [Planctomycetaceae bacterium]|nr:hypothetical protein [Planctomycetaceae bacterium]